MDFRSYDVSAITTFSVLERFLFGASLCSAGGFGALGSWYL